MTKQCVQCSKELTSKWVTKKTRFCSKVCSNLYRAANSNFYEVHSLKLKEKSKNDPWGAQCMSTEKRAEICRSRTHKRLSWVEKVFARDWSELSWDYKKMRVKIEQESKCAFCNLSEWRGVKMSLEIDHIDGCRSNNSRENLRALCPNCHMTTDTYRGRNKLRGKFPPDNVIYQKYKEVGNVRQTLLAFNLAAKGGNYARVKDIIQKFEPHTQTETIIQYV